MEPLRATAPTLVPSVAGGTDPMQPEPFRVARVQRETKDTFTLTMEPVASGRAFPFVPGQFNMVYAFGIGESAISISGDPGTPQKLVHTVRAVGEVTRAICAAKRGTVFGVRGPFGRGWPVEVAAGGDVVIVAGGVGLAPLRPVIHHVLTNRDCYGQVSILYGSRTPADLLYDRELRQLRSRFDLDVRVCVDAAAGDWHGVVGPVTVLIPPSTFDAAKATAFVCGPEIMMRFVARELEGRGVPLENIYVSAERNMKCAIGFCGHCQWGPRFVCRDGPVFTYAELAPLMRTREL